MADEPSARAEEIRMRKMQAALISRELRTIIDNLPNMDIPEMRDAVRRFVVTGSEGAPEGDLKKVLLQVLDMFEETGPLVFVVQLKDGTRKNVKVQAKPKWSPFFISLIRRVLSTDYGRYLAEKDPIGLASYSLEGRVERSDAKKRGSITDWADIG